MAKTKINSSVLSQISGIGNASKELQKIGDRRVLSEDNCLNFSFNVDKTLIDFIRKFVDLKRSNPNDFHYNQTDAIREGLALLKSSYKEIEERPLSVKIPTRKGRVLGSTIEDFNRTEKTKTSFRINEIEKEFIYDFIYYKSLSDKNYDKEKFLDEIIKLLKKHYKMK